MSVFTAFAAIGRTLLNMHLRTSAPRSCFFSATASTKLLNLLKGAAISARLLDLVLHGALRIPHGALRRLRRVEFQVREFLPQQPRDTRRDVLGGNLRQRGRERLLFGCELRRPGFERRAIGPHVVLDHCRHRGGEFLGRHAPSSWRKCAGTSAAFFSGPASPRAPPAVGRGRGAAASQTAGGRRVPRVPQSNNSAAGTMATRHPSPDRARSTSSAL